MESQVELNGLWVSQVTRNASRSFRPVVNVNLESSLGGNSVGAACPVRKLGSVSVHSKEAPSQAKVAPYSLLS